MTTTLKIGTKVIICEDTIECSNDISFLEKLIGKTLEIVEVTNEYKDENLPTYKCKYENGSIVTVDGIKYFPFVDADLKIKKDQNARLLEIIIGSNEEMEFLKNKLSLLEKLSIKFGESFDNHLISIIDNADDINFDGLIYETLKNIGELAIKHLFNLNDFCNKYNLNIDEIVDKYNIPAPSGLDTVFDSILSKFDLENITDSDIKDFKHEIIEDFNLHQKYFSNTSVFEFENDEELAKHIKFCESYLNYHLLNDTQYVVEIYETDDVYEDDEESSYDGKSMYEGKIKHKNTEEELEDSTSGRYCEISSVFEELLDYINNDLQQTQEIDDWLYISMATEDSCCPKCKGFNYTSEEHFEGNEIFRKWTCSCGSEWTERYNLTKVFYGGQDKEIKSELEENLAYENKQMGDFLESLGFTPDDITSLIINGDAAQKAKALKRAKAPFEVKVNSTLAQQILDLLNNELSHSDTSFTHDSDKTRIFIEIGNDLDDEEFKDGYKSLKEILGVSNLDTFILVDY